MAAVGGTGQYVSDVDFCNGSSSTEFLMSAHGPFTPQ